VIGVKAPTAWPRSIAQAIYFQSQNQPLGLYRVYFNIIFYGFFRAYYQFKCYARDFS
jgi:hypothetical protein